MGFCTHILWGDGWHHGRANHPGEPCLCFPVAWASCPRVFAFLRGAHASRVRDVGLEESPRRPAASNFLLGRDTQASKREVPGQLGYLHPHPELTASGAREKNAGNSPDEWLPTEITKEPLWLMAKKMASTR
jgi:hypothetical protein